MDPNSKIVVFDLDLTLWPLHVDECVPPFKSENNSVFDAAGRRCSLYPDVLNILNFLVTKNYTLAVASRAKNICASYQLLHFLKIANYFRYKEIYPGSKKQHLRNIVAKSDVDFSRITFFDNDKRNVRDVKSLGVQCFLVDEEISLKLICSNLNLNSSS